MCILQPRRRRTSVVAEVEKAVKYTNYRRAMNIMISKSSKGQRDFVAVLQRAIRREVADYTKARGILMQDVTLESLSSFSWATTLSQVKDLMPFTLAAVEALVTSQGHKDRLHM